MSVLVHQADNVQFYFLSAIHLDLFHIANIFTDFNIFWSFCACFTITIHPILSQKRSTHSDVLSSLIFSKNKFIHFDWKLIERSNIES